MLTEATKIYAANVRGLVKNLNIIKSLQLDQYDILLFSEIWNVKDYEQVNIQGFELATKYQRNNQNGGGVAIFVKIGQKIKILREIICAGVIEAVGIQTNGINIFCIYRPPSGNKQEFIDNLCQLMDNNSGRKIIIGGDFNINGFLSNNILHNWANLYNLKPQINGVTRPQSGSCLDNFYTNIPGKFWISNTSIADHLSIIAEIKSVKEKIKGKKHTYRLMKEQNWIKFGIEIRNIIIHGENTEEKWENLCSDLRKTIEKCFPERKSKQDYKFSMSPGLLKSRDKKNELLKKYKQGKIDKQIYIQYNKVYRKLIIAEKEKEFGKKLNLAGNNSKKKWETLKEELLLKTQKEEINSIRARNKLETEPNNIATAFKNHFETCAIELANNLPDGHPDFSNIEKENDWTFDKTTAQELVKIIKTLEPKNSAGHDLLSNRMIKKEISWFATTLPPLINKSMDEGTFPKVLKRATVIPIHKKGEKDNLNNYRPISLLPVMSKIFEKVINERITKKLDSKGLIDENQYGFRKNHSTEHAIIKFTDQIELELSNKKHVVSVFIDVSKAFDSCDHEILIKKLGLIGISGKSLDLMKSYLKDREQEIWVNGFYGGKFVINIGVGQGTILGPTFFKIYIMDLHKITTLLCVKFADDSNFLGTGKTKDEVETLVNNELDKIHKWFCNNKLTLHPGKSRYIIHSKDKLMTITMGNQQIQRVGYGLQEEAVKLLGVHLDENLDWKIQCKKVEQKIGKGNYLLWRHRRVLTKNTRKMIYESFVKCHLTYCLTAWGPSALKDRNLNKTLKRVIRKLGPRIRHTNKRYLDYNILSLEDELMLAESKLIFKWSKQELPQGLKNLISERNNRTLRNRQFVISNKWKKSSISYRLGIRAKKELTSISKYKNTKSLAKGLKEQAMTILTHKICTVRNCYICRHDPPNPAA